MTSSIPSQFGSSLYAASTVKTTSPIRKVDSNDYALLLEKTSSAPSDTVAISAEGIRRSSDHDNGIPSTASFSDMLHNMPNKGEVADFVESEATSPDDFLVSVGKKLNDPMYYSGTNMLVTDQRTSEFKSTGKEVQAARLKIYQEEKAKGTDPADIWDKMATFMHSLPESFRLKAAGWGNLR